tara:strand:+ start:285 stop:671 length:387 start_codon:yes stop_codon:yes gene_type:complete
MILYVLQCARGRYYVGYTERKELRKHLESHRNGKRCVWTRTYKALKLIKVRTVDTVEDVTEETIQWMRRKGIQKVRGGDFDRFKLSEDDLDRIKDSDSFDYKYTTCSSTSVDRRPTPGMTWHHIPQGT